jgi:hypothetical protein
MIGTKKEKDALKFFDNSEDLVHENGQELLDAVQAAMRAGFTEFTTPTTSDDQQRIDWKVRRWMTIRGGRPACFLVAQKVLNEHFEIVGPEVVLPEPANGPVLQKRTA